MNKEATMHKSSSLVYQYQDVWKRAMFRIKVQRSLRLVKDELLLFGTSHDLADQNMRYKVNIDELIDKKARKAEDFRQQTTNYFLESANYRCLVSPNGTFKQTWNVLITVLMVYTATVMPFRFAFYETVFWDEWTVLELTMDLIFLCDVGVNFFSIYTKGNGYVVIDHKRIAVHYLKTWFALDLVASVPYTLLDLWKSDTTASQPRVNLFLRLARLPRMYKLMRLFRIAKVFKSTVTESESSFLVRLENYLQVNSRIYKLVKFLGTALVAVHIAACVWYFIARVTDFSQDSWVVRFGLMEAGVWTQYLAAFYWTLTTMITVGYGDITPGNTLERLVAMLWMFIGVGFYTFTIGSLSTFLMSIDTRESILTSKLGAVQELYRETGISKATKAKIQQAIRYNTFTLGSVWDRSLFDDLPKGLKYEVVTSMYGGAFKDFPFFSKRDMAFVVYVMPKLRPSTLKENEYLYREGEYADAMHLIARGRMNFVLTHTEIVYKAYMRGSYVGEIELIRGTVREDNTMSYGNTELLSLDKQDFFNMMEEFPVEGKEIERLAGLRQRQNKQAQLETGELLKLRSRLGSLQSLAGRQQILVSLEDFSEQSEDLEATLDGLNAALQEQKTDLMEAFRLVSLNNATLLNIEKRISQMRFPRSR